MRRSVILQQLSGNSRRRAASRYDRATVIDPADITGLRSNAEAARAGGIRPPADTSEEAQRVRLGILRRMSFEQKAEQMSELSETLRESMISGVRFRHPEYGPAEARWSVVRRLLGDDLFAAAFPHAPCVPF